MFWLIVATLCGFFVKGLCGFANTLVFTMILGFTTDNVNISPVEVVLGYPSNFIWAWKERKHLDKKVVLTLSAMVIAGSIPGMFLLKNADARIIKIICGFSVIAIGLEMLLRDRIKISGKQNKRVLLMIGMASGLLSGLYGIGALLAAYVNRVTDSSQAFKGNLCAVFFIENTFRIIMYGFTGIITLNTLWRSVYLMPVMLFGMFLGMKSGAVLDENVAKKVVIVMLIVSGVAMIINSIG